MSEEVKSADPQEQKQPTIQEILVQLGGPDSAQIENWKLKYGDVFVSAMDETNVFVFRAIKRFEYRQFQTKLNSPENKMDNFDYEEEVCKLCTLWPENLNPALQKGGTATTLSEQIFQNSNFYNPQQAAALVMKL